MNVLTSNRRAAAAPLILAAVVLGLLVFLAFNSLFIVREWDQVVITQFGKIQGKPIREAGLHFKKPFIQELHRFEKRLVRWDGEPFTLYTTDRRTILVNVTARWRIDDATEFLPSVRTVENANRFLLSPIEAAVRNQIANYDLFEVVRSTNQILQEADLPLDLEGAEEEIDLEDMATLGREIHALPQAADGSYVAGRPYVTEKILEDARTRLAELELGIHLEDILIKQVNYTRDIESNVYAQMNAELAKISAGFRSHGRKNAEQKLGEMERDLAEIESAAIEESQVIHGRAEAEAIHIYAEAYNQDPDFYRFLRTLEAFQNTLGQNSSLVISTESAFFDLLKNPAASAGENLSASPDQE